MLKTNQGGELYFHGAHAHFFFVVGLELLQKCMFIYSYLASYHSRMAVFNL